VVANDEREQVLNRALLRLGRFDRQVTILLPTLIERAAILAVPC
jgi:ATP-dependent Zn protease